MANHQRTSVCIIPRITSQRRHTPKRAREADWTLMIAMLVALRPVDMSGLLTTFSRRFIQFLLFLTIGFGMSPYLSHGSPCLDGCEAPCIPNRISPLLRHNDVGKPLRALCLSVRFGGNKCSALRFCVFVYSVHRIACPYLFLIVWEAIVKRCVDRDKNAVQSHLKLDTVTGYQHTSGSLREFEISNLVYTSAHYHRNATCSTCHDFVLPPRYDQTVVAVFTEEFLLNCLNRIGRYVA
jgi:hypothetical protein